MGSLEPLSANRSVASNNTMSSAPLQLPSFISKAQTLYNGGNYSEALAVCEKIYDFDAHRTENLLLMGAIHFQLRNYSESVFYNQQCIRVDPNFAEAYSNLGNALKELGDLKGATQFYSKAIKLKPRFSDAYNNLASAYMLQGRVQQAMETYQMALVLNPQLTDAHTNLGNLYKATGDMEAAKQCYLEAIRINPEFSIAWNNLAGIFKEEGQLQTAVAYYREALRLCPEFADAHSNLGNALKEQHQVQDAIACYQQAIKLRPDFAIAHGNLGSCYYDLGDFAAAIKCFNYAIQLEPNFPDAYNNLGNALKEEGRLDEAINSYRAALHLKPDHPHAYNNLGNAMIEKGFIKEAIHCYVTAIRLMPRFSAAHSNLGSVFKEQGKFDQAVAHYLEAIQIDPNFADAYCNLGNAYKELGNVEEAMACYKTALNLEPQYVEALVCLAATLKDSGKLTDAVQHYRKALELRPDCAEALANLVHANVLLCDWRDRDSDMLRLSQLVAAQLGTNNNNFNNNNNNINNNNSSNVSKLQRGLPAVQPFHCLVYPVSLQEMLLIAKKYAAQAKLSVALADVAPQGYKHVAHVSKSDRDKELLSLSLPTNNNSLGDTHHSHSVVSCRQSAPGLQLHALKNGHRLRIGYVSSDFNHHPLGQLLQQLFRCHDTHRFEVFCYALSVSDGSATRLEIESSVEHFLDVSQWHASDIARHIHDTDRIHVLINLNGYTKGSKNEIFALKPAPIQASFLGFCGTMGASDYIQYLVCDTCVVPPHLRPFYSEKTLNMPHSYFANSHSKAFSDSELSRVLGADYRDTRVTRAKYGLSDDAFVFCNFNQNYKIDPVIFATWMRILKRVPNSVLWLLRFPAAAESHLRHEARRHGVRDTQLVFSELVCREEHVARGFLADLCLDTPLCNAHTTACDILYVGTPLLTLPGEKMASRVAASLLRALGDTVAKELICDTLAEYEERAVQLAEDSDRLYTLRQTIETVRDSSAAFDSLRWTKNFEHGLCMAYKRFELGLSPDHLEVEDRDPVVLVSDKDGEQLL